jgi:ABC-type ATPase with predicted acetyltransferase domain
MKKPEREFFRIRHFKRRYDAREGKFIINIAYETAAEPTPRTVAVAEAFGLGLDEHRLFVVYDNVELKIGARDIVYITGDSGSGKSVLLRALRRDLGDSAIDLAEIQTELTSH